MDQIIAFWGHHCIMAGIWLILTLSLNLINGYCGLFSLGHQGFWAVGAYSAAVLVTQLIGAGCPSLLAFVLSFPFAMLMAAFFGALVGIPCLRLRGDYLAIATLGFSEILRNLILNSESLGMSLGISVPNIIRQQVDERRNMYFIYLILVSLAIVFTLFVLRNLIRSSHGRAIMAIRDDDRVAELLGVNLTRYKVLVFVTGAAFAGLAGAMFANFNTLVSPDDFSFNIGVLMVVMVVLGGMGSLAGTVVATLLLYFTPVILQIALPADFQVPVFYDPTQGGVVYRDLKGLWQVFFSVLLIVVVLVRPQGIMGQGSWRWPWARNKTTEAKQI